MAGSQERGRARLKLRLPDWRARFELASGHTFLDVRMDCDLAWEGLEHWTRSNAPKRDEMIREYCEVLAFLERDAQLSAAIDD